MRLIQFFQTGKKIFNVDQILDNIRVKPSWVKLGERNPSLAAQKELAEIELRDPALFFVRTASWFCYPLDWHHRELYSGLINFSVNFVKYGLNILPFFRRITRNFKGQSFDSDKPPKQYFQKIESCVIVFLKLKLFFVTSQTPKFKTDNHDTIFFRWQLLLLTVNAQTNYVQYFLWILYHTKLIFIRK